ncbi:hypothetical protein ACTMU2_00825 [Cupriavidus basilensis]
MNRISASTLGAIAMALLLAACGGGGDDAGTGGNPGDNGNSGNNGNNGGTTSAFTQSATWTFALPASGSAICYDFNTRAEVANCSEQCLGPEGQEQRQDGVAMDQQRHQR